MKIFASQSRAYRSGLLFLLLILVVVFVRLARWRMAQYDPPSPYGQYSPGGHDARVKAMPIPTARVERGAVVQGSFTLLAATRTGQVRSSPPPGLEQGGPTPVFFVGQSAEGTGLWIEVQGGIGILTRAIPVDGVRHLLPFGPNATFVATFTPATKPPVRVTPQMLLGHYLLGRPLPPRTSGGGWTGTQGWYDHGGVASLPYGTEPYIAEQQLSSVAAGSAAKFASYMFVPRWLSTQFLITAQPQAASGMPLGAPVRLECQPVNSHVLFVCLPAAYSDATKRMTVTVTRAARPADRGVWHLADLPPAQRNGPDARPARTAVSFGALSIQATATEAEDVSGNLGFSSRPPTGRALPNADAHPRSGVPTLDYTLRLRNSAHRTAEGQEWTVRTERVTPQWSLPPPPKLPSPSSYPSSSPGRTLVSVDRIYPSGDDPRQPGGRWQEQERQVGVAYPGQQHWLQFDGTATRTGYQFETITLRDADIIFDAAAGHWRVSWRRAQSVTTPGGVAVTTLNARPGPPHTVASHWGGSRLQFTSAADHAEMYLAWRLPSGLIGSGLTLDGTPRQAYPPGAFGGVVSDFESDELPPDWHDVWVPGVPLPAPVRSATGRMAPPPTLSTALGPLIHDGWRPLHYALRLAGTMPARGASAYSGAPAGRLLPTHLEALVFRVYYRAPLETHPFTLVVPIGSRPSPPTAGTIMP